MAEDDTDKLNRDTCFIICPPWQKRGAIVRNCACDDVTSQPIIALTLTQTIKVLNVGPELLTQYFILK